MLQPSRREPVSRSAAPTPVHGSHLHVAADAGVRGRVGGCALAALILRQCHRGAGGHGAYVSVKGPFAHSALIPVAACLDRLVCGVPPQRGPPIASGKPNLLLLPESKWGSLFCCIIALLGTRDRLELART